MATNFGNIVIRDLGGIFAPLLLRGPNESGEEVVSLGGVAGLLPGSMGIAGATMAVSLTFGVIVLVGFVAAARQRITVAEFLVPVAVAIVLLWPFWSFRFVLPLTPYLFFYLVAGLQALTRSPQAIRIVLLCIIGLSLYDHTGYIVLGRGHSAADRVEWLGDAKHVDAALDWIHHHLGHDGTIASTNPALLYLRTGRRSIAYDDPTIDLSKWKARGVRYVACLVAEGLPPDAGQYTILYRSPAGFWVIEL
jgi:hypothetical protein